MGLFDRYMPEDELECPICHVVLTDWQGKDAAAALFIWRRGHPEPVGQDAGSWSIPEADRAQVRLPDRFSIYSGDCGKHVDAIGRCEDGVWMTTEVVEAHPIRATFVAS